MPEAFFTLIFGGLLTAPIGGYLVHRRTMGLSPRDRWRVIVTAIGALGLVGFEALSKFSFRGILADGALLCFAYLAYAFLVFSLPATLPRPARVFAQMLGCVPIVVLYLFSTIGIIGFGVVVLNQVPRHREQLSQSDECRILLDGAAFSSGGRIHVHRYRQWRWLPIVERRIQTEVLESDEWPNTIPYGELCQRLLLADNEPPNQ